MRSIVAAIVWMATVAMDAAWIWVVIGTDFLDQAQASATDTQPAPIDNLFIYLALGAIAAVNISYVSIGLVLAGRSGAGRIAGVLLAGGFLFAAVPFGYTIGGALVLAEPANPLFNAIFLLGPALYGLGSALILPGLALIFPDGRLPSRAWRAPVGIVVGLLVAGTIVVVVTPGEVATSPGSSNPFGVPGLPEAVSASGLALSSIGILGISMLGVGAVIARYRRGNTLARQQLRWFAAAVLLAAVPLPLSILPGGGGPAWIVLAAVGLLLVPVAVWIAVTRHRLYEIDRIISRTIAYGVVTGVLALTFGATILLLQAVLSQFTQDQTVAVAASTLAAFALFQPVRRRVQRGVDRRFNRAQYDAERTVQAFAGRLRDELDLPTLTAELRRTSSEAVQPKAIAVWLRGGGT